MRSRRPHLHSRRRFLKQAGAAGFAIALPRFARGSAENQPGTPESPHSPQPVENRAPLAPNVFYPLPLGAVRPTGWLRSQLQIQANGLGGHLDQTWPDVGPNSGWLGGTGESWERGPYFLDGLVPLAYLLDDPVLKAKAQKFIDWTLTNQQPNGMIGPRSNDDWWPRMVMLKALTQYEEATRDPRVVPVLSRYFLHQLSALPSRPLRDWGKYRWQDEALSVLWLYNRTGNPQLLDLVRLLHHQGYDWQSQFANFQFTQRITPEAIGLNSGKQTQASMQTHGVNNAQALKASPVWSLVSNSDEDRHAIFRQLAALDRFHGLPNGMFSADEHFAGRNPSQGTELCTVVEAMFSLEQSLAILGRPELADRLEQIAFNALPGTFTDDMWAHQYNQEPNQVECSLHHKPWTTDGPESNLYGLEPNFGCCTANFHQGWPKFTASLWMSSPSTPSGPSGLVAAAYAPCQVRTHVDDTPVHLIEETEYPFRGLIRIHVSPASPTRFSLRLRVPSWAAGASLKVNGRPQSTPRPNTFAELDRTWGREDVVELLLPLTPALFSGFPQPYPASDPNDQERYQGFNDSISLRRGPLIFSYPIGEDWVRLRRREMTSDWQVYPTTPWNYALAVDSKNVHALEVQEHPIGTSPFSLPESPVKLVVPARKLPAWRSVDGVADPVPQSPVESTEPEEQITLIPYAAAKLRITAFPQLKS